ncbi:MAG: hydrogenase maturation nickel metallochaperone HypA [Schlesneria sp.]
MHERSLVKGLIEQVLEEGRNRRLSQIHEIRISIGEFSGVEPLLVKSAFDEMAGEYWLTPVQLAIEVIPLSAICLACQSSFCVTDFRFVCPKCGGSEVKVTGGEELRLVSLRAEAITE